MMMGKSFQDACLGVLDLSGFCFFSVVFCFFSVGFFSVGFFFGFVWVLFFGFGASSSFHKAGELEKSSFHVFIGVGVGFGGGLHGTDTGMVKALGLQK